MKRNLFPLIMLSIIVILIFSSISCKKDQSPQATINVLIEKDGTYIPVEGAIVTVYIDPTMNNSTYQTYNAYIDAHQDSLIRQEQQITDELGQTHHKFHYESILHVEAKYGVKKNDTISGFGALVLEEDKTYAETIKLKR